MYGLINVFATQQFRSFWLGLLFPFFFNCKGLKIEQIAQINQLFQILNSICAFGDAFYGLTRILMSKNVNNDVSKDSPIIQL